MSHIYTRQPSMRAYEPPDSGEDVPICVECWDNDALDAEHGMCERCARQHTCVTCGDVAEITNDECTPCRRSIKTPYGSASVHVDEHGTIILDFDDPLVEINRVLYKVTVNADIKSGKVWIRDYLNRVERLEKPDYAGCTYKMLHNPPTDSARAAVRNALEPVIQAWCDNYAEEYDDMRQESAIERIEQTIQRVENWKETLNKRIENMRDMIEQIEAGSTFTRDNERTLENATR